MFGTDKNPIFTNLINLGFLNVLKKRIFYYLKCIKNYQFTILIAPEDTTKLVSSPSVFLNLYAIYASLLCPLSTEV